jgi:hypothetical protein
MNDLTPNPPPAAELVEDVSRLIVDATRQTAAAINFGLTALYWRIGKIVQQEVLGRERGAYGEQIVVTLSRQLSSLLPLKQPFQREFYAEMCRIEGWSVRTLRERIDSMLYERTALSKQPDALIQQELTLLRNRGDVTPALVLKDPYVLDFLGLSDRFLERDLEEAWPSGIAAHSS